MSPALGGIAQLGERRSYKANVPGSSPGTSTEPPGSKTREGAIPELPASSPITQKAKRLDSKSGVSAFDSLMGHVTTVEVSEVVQEVADSAAACEEFCCTRRETPEAAAARKERRKTSYDNAVRLLVLAEEGAKLGEYELAKLLVEIAGQWDTIGY